MSEVRKVLEKLTSGDTAGSERLVVLLYDELRAIARGKLAGERPGQTLDATGLVHEAYLRLVADGRPVRWDSRGHFLAAAARAMRRILIERARRSRQPRGARTPTEPCVDLDPANLLAINEALDNLQSADPVSAQLAELRIFAGLSVTEAGSALGMSRATAYRNWRFARAWLQDFFSEDTEDSEKN